MKRMVFIGFLVTLALAPLPFASNRPWSWSLLSMIVGLLMVAWAIGALRDKNMVAIGWRRVWPFLVMFTVIYTLLFALFIFLLNEKIQHGPVAEDFEKAGQRA